ncbi:MAG: sulfatase-like hydrolase/transferase [Verrucomicrobiota bacterium]
MKSQTWRSASTPLLLSVSVLVLLSASVSLSRSSESQPNLVVFLIDDMGLMDTSVAFLTDDEGNPKRYPLNDLYRTPSMERLAAQGIRFNQFYAMSVCSPTRISIMTGQNAARHRSTNWINPWQNNQGDQGPEEWNWEGLDSNDVTLPGLLRSAGYRTIHVGKGHFGPEETEGEDPGKLGFDINIAGDSFGAPGSHYAEKNFGWGTKRERSAVPHLEDYHGSDTFLTEALTIEAKKAVKEAVAEEKPFYLYFSHYAVHAPFESDPRFAANYESAEFPDSARVESAKAFATLVEGIDKSLGDMLDQFEDLGIAEDTLVIFLGDNGSDAPLGDQHEVACSAPLRGKKGAHYEGGMRVPFIASWAKRNDGSAVQKSLPIPADTIQPQVADVTDLFPTLLTIAGANGEVPNDYIVDGSDLATLLSGEADETKPESFLMHYPHGPHRSNYFTVWRNGDWKLIFHALPEIPAHGGHMQFEDGNFQLFNLADDPFEQKNLAKEEEETLMQMIEEMSNQLEAHEAVYPVDAEGNDLKPRLN